MSPTLVWAILGMALLVAELATGSFFLVFFGVAALLVALARLAGLDHLAAELILFALLGMGGVLVFRRKFMQSFRGQGGNLGDVNQKLKLDSDIPAHGTGQVEYQGTVWTAVNESGHDLKKGDTVTIARTQGVRLVVK